MKFPAIEKQTAPETKLFTTELLTSEAYRAHELYLSGILREIYFNDEHCAVLILECENREMAVGNLAGLPLAEHGFVRFELMELKPYTGYEQIISNR